jgi:putative hemolysin
MKAGCSCTILIRGVLVLGLLALVVPVTAMMNPSAGYCDALGYTYSMQPDPGGNIVGYCTLPDGRTLDAWEFLLGQAGQNASYCARMGYTSRVVNDSLACGQFLQQSCLACVFPNGSGMEVTQAMGLDFRETICIRGTCRDPKDYPPPPPYLIPSSGSGVGSPLPPWAVPAGLLVVLIAIAGVIAGNRRKGKAP